MSSLVHAFHQRECDADEAALDAALGLPSQRWAPDAERDTELQRAHPREQIINVATPYDRCRELVDALALTADDLVVDLGCGMGRFLLYAALVTPSRFRGVEMVEERVRVARASVAMLDLASRVQIAHGNVLDQSLQDATVFYLFRPFSVETEAEMLTRLHEEARRRVITVVSLRMSPASFDARVFERRAQRGEADKSCVVTL